MPWQPASGKVLNPFPMMSGADKSDQARKLLLKLVWFSDELFFINKS
jgi:hypothetical protein